MYLFVVSRGSEGENVAFTFFRFKSNFISQEQKKIDDRVCTESPWYAALFGSKEDCKEIVRKHPFLNVIGVVIEGFFVKPFHYLGSGLGGFCYRFFGEISRLC